MALKYFLFIRHGKTSSNLERRYIGNPNEPLCAEGIREAENLKRSSVLPNIDAVYSSTALRCRQTAEILFPHVQYKICGMSEIDFGIFKGKNAADLLGNSDYEKWLGTNCMGDIPGGESVSEFRDKCCDEFMKIASESLGVTALIIHGGNIMSILERLVLPKRDFYSYHIPNCGFFLCSYVNGTLHIES